ncbi:MAG: ComF family protein [Desulfovibrio sp.]|jgi:ComF family protein|nr:ComF family protein [Desulfovibrio sp.]
MFEGNGKERGAQAFAARLRSPVLTALRRIFGERRCAACSRVFDAGSPEGAASGFCPDCLEQLPRRTGGFCPHCGEPSAWAALPVSDCAHCLKVRPPWQSFFFHGLHQGLLRRMLIDLKFRDRPQAGEALGGLLASHPACAALEADAIVPVPLHRDRLLRRGYNQALEIARPLARHLDLPVLPGLIARARATAPQTGADRALRARNIAGAFAVSGKARGLRILLLDDTMTTGATMAEATRGLLAGGAASVMAAAVSRASLF